jgi:hypothetical protein
VKENSTSSGKAGGKKADERKLVTKYSTRQVTDLNEFARKKDERETLAWRRERGLLTKNDYGRDYIAIRKSRGLYRVPLPEDLIE